MSPVGTLLSRWAARAPARVFPVVGAGARRAVEDLGLRPDVDLVASPRHADVLLVAGRLPPALLKPAARVHDQMPGRRGVLCWGPFDRDGLFPDAVRAPLPAPGDPRLDAAVDDAAAAVARLHRDLVSGERDSSPPVQPDHPPAPWRGVGPHGQGGSGMMGGRPYGRPMAMREEARDGLALDRIRVPVGPFFDPFPPGLVLHVGLQGDVIQAVDVAPNPFLAIADAVPAPAWTRPGSIAGVELARARHHLRWLARALRVTGLAALGTRVLRMAAAPEPPDPAVVERFGRRLERSGILALFARGVGRVDSDRAEVFGGPVARAAGIDRDARSDDPAYRGLGFEPVVRAGGDVEARWRVRIDEAVASLEMTRRGADLRPEGPVEPFAPAWAPDTLGDVLVGLEWGDAVTTIVSLGVDLEADARPAAAEAVA